MSRKITDKDIDELLRRKAKEIDRKVDINLEELKEKIKKEVEKKA